MGVTPFLEDLSKKGLTVERLYSVVPHTTKALIPIVAGIYPYLQPDVYEAIPGILPPKALPYLLKNLVTGRPFSRQPTTMRRGHR